MSEETMIDQRQLKIAIVIPDVIVDPNDSSDAPVIDTLKTANAIGETLTSLGYSVEMTALTAITLRTKIKEAKEKGMSVIFNVCETLPGGEEHQVVEEIENQGLKYTGSPAEALRDCLDKELTKKKLRENGLPVAWGFVVGHEDEIKWPDGAPETLFVKPKDWDGSVGIDPDSIVHNLGELKAIITKLRDMEAIDVLVEDFIEGREFNVGLIEDQKGLKVLPIAEITYKNGQKAVTHGAKWNEGGQEDQNTPVICPADISDDLKAQLENISKRSFQIMGCRGYGRVDIRVRDGKAYILEVNPNCGMAGDSGFFREVKASLSEEQKENAYALMVEAFIWFAMNRDN